MGNIQYPYAKAGDSTIRVSAAKRGGDYTCLGCAQPMIPKLGDTISHHFAHKYAGDCNPDNALHKSTIAHIMALFQDGRTLTITCRARMLTAMSKYPTHIGRFVSTIKPSLHNYEFRIPGDSIHDECHVLPPSRSDIVTFNGSIPKLIVEVVVSHEMEPVTRARYKKSGLPVLVIKPEFTSAFIAFDAMFEINAPPCPVCIKIVQYWKRWERGVQKVTRLRYLQKQWLDWTSRLEYESSSARLELEEKQLALWKQEHIGQNRFEQESLELERWQREKVEREKREKARRELERQEKELKQWRHEVQEILKHPHKLVSSELVLWTERKSAERWRLNNEDRMLLEKVRHRILDDKRLLAKKKREIAMRETKEREERERLASINELNRQELARYWESSTVYESDSRDCSL